MLTALRKAGHFGENRPEDDVAYKLAGCDLEELTDKELDLYEERTLPSCVWPTTSPTGLPRSTPNGGRRATTIRVATCGSLSCWRPEQMTPSETTPPRLPVNGNLPPMRPLRPTMGTLGRP